MSSLPCYLGLLVTTLSIMQFKLMQIGATSCDTCRPEKNPQDSLCSESDLQVLLGFRQ